MDRNTARLSLRGGSWDGLQDFARAGFRPHDYQDSRLDLYGFRMVCASPTTNKTTVTKVKNVNRK